MIVPENSRETVSVSTICDKYCSQAIFWSLSGYKELKLTTKPFAGRTLHDR